MIGNQLQVADGKELDRETVEVHKLTVLATDEGKWNNKNGFKQLQPNCLAFIS